jgi:hypothetical protein
VQRNPWPDQNGTNAPCAEHFEDRISERRALSGGRCNGVQRILYQAVVNDGERRRRRTADPVLPRPAAIRVVLSLLRNQQVTRSSRVAGSKCP